MMKVHFATDHFKTINSKMAWENTIKRDEHIRIS